MPQISIFCTVIQSVLFEIRPASLFYTYAYIPCSFDNCRSGSSQVLNPNNLFLFILFPILLSRNYSPIFRL
jgi:hypothetical protein